MIMRVLNAVASLALASLVSAQNVTNCVSGGVCYTVNVPEVTASRGSGDIFIQISGPSSMSWIGVGQGTGMAGSNIFMIYANEAGDNVTLSPRVGVGERQPLTRGSTSQVALLEGSGIMDSMMIANFRCSNCNSWTGGTMDFTDSQSNWIYAYQRGQAISSNSIDASLTQHTNYGEMTLNLQTAAGGSAANPFIGAATSQTPTSGTGSGSNSETDSGSTSTEGSGSGTPSNFNTVLMAHGILAPIAFVIFYPLGAISIRLLSFPGLVWLHAGWMAFTYLIVLAAMGLGIWIAVTIDLIDSYHAIIGLVVVGCLLFQPITGLFHHRKFKRNGGPSAFTYGHVWWGRAVITLGIINGGLGLRLAGNTRNGEIAYGVVAGVMWVTWMAVVILATIRNKGTVWRERSNGSNEKMNNSPSLQQNGSVRNSYSRREGSPTMQGAGRTV